MNAKEFRDWYFTFELSHIVDPTEEGCMEAYHKHKMEWVNVDDNLPDENQTVWACNIKKGWVMLACLIYEDGWLWAVSNGLIYAEDGKIVSECEMDDDYEVTHWIALPELPKSV